MSRAVTTARALCAAALTVLCASPQSADALGMFSRACNFTELGPTNQQEYFAVTRQTIGGVPIHQTTADVKGTLWALESLTTDWGQFRYWLLAYSGQYLNNQLWRTYQSVWAANSLWDNNRGLAFSARAGRDFRVFGADSDGLFEPLVAAAFQVQGVHYYYDPDAGRFVFMGISRIASNCNCAEWGFEYSWLNALPSFFCRHF